MKEDLEAMAACTPIPILDIFCDAVGAIIEVPLQGVATLEGAKAALESISAAGARKKENAELILAAKQQEEATRLATEAGEFQTKAEEEGGKASIEESDSDALRVEAEEAEVFGEDKLEESKSEETLAAVEEGVSINYHLGI